MEFHMAKRAVKYLLRLPVDVRERIYAKLGFTPMREIPLFLRGHFTVKSTGTIDFA